MYVFVVHNVHGFFSTLCEKFITQKVESFIIQLFFLWKQRGFHYHQFPLKFSENSIHIVSIYRLFIKNFKYRITYFRIIVGNVRLSDISNL